MSFDFDGLGTLLTRRVLVAPALLGWLRDVSWTTCQGGSTLIRRFPKGHALFPSDAGMLIAKVHGLGLIEWSGHYDASPSLRAWNSLSYGGKPPEKRPDHVEPELKVWRPGLHSDVLANIANIAKINDPTWPY